MAVIGSYGKVVFEVSDSTARSFDNGFQHETGARLESIDIIGKEPRVTFSGPDTESISFNLKLVYFLGVDPRTEYENLRSLCRSGIASSFVIGGKPVGEPGVLWLIEKLSANYTHFGPSGLPLIIEVSVTLKRYKPWSVK